VIVTTAHQSASPPVMMFASGDWLSNWSTSTLARTSTRNANSTVTNAAYSPRFLTTS
jgi:hypothetical protein